MLSLQSARLNGAKLDAPEPDGFSADGDASFSEKIFYIAMAQIKSLASPDVLGNNEGASGRP